MKKTYLFFILIFLFSLKMTYAQVPTNGLIASYPFSGNANDTSGNNLNGTVYGATLTIDRFGNANSAYSFDSSNYIEVASNSIFDNNEGSICFWIKDSTPPNSHGCAIIYKVNLSNGVMVNEYSTSYDIGVIDYSNGVQAGMTVTPTTFDANWHFCVFTYQSNGNKYSYLDGVQIGSDTVGSFNFTSSSTLRFGLAQDTWWDAYTGVLDGIMIYNRALTTTEVQQLYNLPNPNLSNGLIASYPFSGNANDASGNGNNGTVFGAILTTDRFGNTNSAYSFDSATSYITIANTLLPNPTSFSINYWFNMKYSVAYGNGYMIISDRDGNDCGYKYASSITGNNEVGFGELVETPIWTFNDITDTTSFPVNTWTMVTCVYDYANSLMSLYANGLLSGTVTSSIFNITSNPTTIGALQGGGSGCTYQTTQFMDGDIDDISIYDRVLSPIEIQALYGNYTVTTTGTTSIISSTSTVGIKIYPNPAMDYIKVQNANTRTYSLSIINSLSQQVLSTSISSGVGTVNISSLTKGLYFVQILNANSNTVEVQKLIVE